MKFSNYIWFIYLIIFPFQFFKEGDPQIADILGVILIATNAKSIVLSVRSNAFTKTLYLFLLYTIIINSIWMLMLSKILIIKSSLYYVYSFLLMLFVVSKIEDKSFLKITLNGIGISLLVQLLLYPFMPDQGERAIMFFNQTNQLAFWALSIAVLTIVIQSTIKIKNLYAIGIILACTFFIAITGSRSAVFGIIIFWIFFFVKSMKHILILATLLIAFFMISLVNNNLDLEKLPAIGFFIERMEHESLGTGNQGLDHRGYDRILKFPQYLLFGAGEGENWRFNNRIEIHSTTLNILFSYGIIGFTLFLVALWHIVKRPTKELIVLLLVYGIYMNVHMALRVPLFWMTLFFLFYLSHYKRDADTILINN